MNWRQNRGVRLLAAVKPAVLASGREVFLSWFTADEGYRLIPMTTLPVARAER